MKQAFFNFILIILRDHLKFLNYGKALEYQAKKTKFYSVFDLFDFDSYIKSQAAHERQFYTQFVQTQLFVDYIEKVLFKEANKKNFSIKYFVSCSEIVSQQIELNVLLKFQEQNWHELLNKLA